MTRDISLACRDWHKRIMTGISLLPDFPNDDISIEAAERAVEVWGGLKIPFMVGDATFGAIGTPWFSDFLHTMFLMDGSRRVIREAFVMTPKKSGVATNCAALLLTALILNRRPAAKFAIISVTMEIAKIVLESMVAMIAADAELSQKFIVRKHTLEIEHRQTGAKVCVKALNVDALTGARLSGAVVYNMQFMQTDRFDASMRHLRGALSGEQDSFLIMTATQSLDPPSGVFLKELTRARATRDGEIDGGVLPLIYEPPAGVDWRDPANFPRLHPGVGYTVAAEHMEQEMAYAERLGDLPYFAAKWLNVEQRRKDLQ